MDNKNIVIGIVLVLSVSLTLWLAQSHKDQSTTKIAPSHTPDYYFHGVTAVLMSIDGEPSQQLIADVMTHYPDDDSTELVLPKLTIFDAQNPPWRVNSETGWVSGDGEVLLLSGKVRIDRSAAPEVRAMHMTTKDLRVQPKENYAETDAKVHAWSHGDIIDAKGMRAWFNKPIRIKLLANVKGHYNAKK